MESLDRLENKDLVEREAVPDHRDNLVNPARAVSAERLELLVSLDFEEPMDCPDSVVHLVSLSFFNSPLFILTLQLK